MLSRDEQTLIDGCKRGDERAWLALYNAYAADVGRYLRGMLKAGTDIDDLVQKVFLQFLNSLARFRGESGLRTWLHGIARHIAMHAIRGDARRNKHIAAYAAEVSTTGPHLEAQLSARSELSHVQTLLQALDPALREVWLLREMHGFTPAEVAAIVDAPAGTVRTRHHRARAQLRALLERDETPNKGRPGLHLVAGGPS